jgi:deazaflavin-dependent oxidoreductase (nitroreductase family)
MVKKYEVTPGIRRINRVFAWMARRGVGQSEVLTTTGRRSGLPRTTPVTPIEAGGIEYLVSPYGVTGWVGNVRAHPEAELRRGSKVRTVRLTEVSGPDVAGVVAAYHAREGFSRKYMDLPDDPGPDDFAAAWRLFPVFRVDGSDGVG